MRQRYDPVTRDKPNTGCGLRAEALWKPRRTFVLFWTLAKLSVFCNSRTPLPGKMWLGSLSGKLNSIQASESVRTTIVAVCR